MMVSNTRRVRKSAFRQCLGKDAALRRPDGAARRPYQKLICSHALESGGKGLDSPVQLCQELHYKDERQGNH
jgi:hypothetical protein